MFKFCEIIGISKIEFSSFSGNESVKQNIKKPIGNLLSLQVNHFSSNFNKSQTFFGFFTENWTLSLPVPHWAGANTDLPSNCNISKMARVNIAFKKCFLKRINKLYNYMQVDRLCTCGSLVIDAFSDTERVKLLRNLDFSW